MCLFSLPDSDHSNVQLSFPSKNVINYVRIDLPSSLPPLTAFTVCLWIKVTDQSERGALFSYAVVGVPDEILLYKYSSLRLLIKNGQR